MHTFYRREITFIFTHNVVLLLWLHVRPLKVRFVKDELVWTCSAGEGIAAVYISCCLLNR